MTLASRVRAIFARAWKRYGKPVMSTVPPIASWSLPAGYTHSAALDGIRTGSGAVLTDLDDLSEYYASGVVYIVPTRSLDDLRSMVAAGIAPEGQLEVFVLAADLATVRGAFAVQVNGQWYDVASIAAEPSGTSDVWARVRLTRRS